VVSATVFDWLYNAGRWTWHDPDGYNFISGPLADLTLLGGGYAILRRHNCHYVVCHKHNPEPSPTAEQIQAAHAAHRDAMQEARATAVATVHDVTKVAHEVAADVHEVAEDVHEAESSGHKRPPDGEQRE